MRRPDREYLAVLLLTIVVGLGIFAAVRVLWLLNIYAQNAAAG